LSAAGSNSSFFDLNYTNAPDTFYLIQVFP